MAAQIWNENLPPDYSCNVTSDGRIFFINEVTKKSSWLHPVTKVTVQTGHRALADLPQGWERGITAEGVPYYIDHTNQQTSLLHPVTGQSEVQVEAIHSPAPESPRIETTSVLGPSTNGINQESRRQGRKSALGSWVKGPCLPRPETSSTTLQGWLLKQGSDGLHLWKRRWFVLSEFCLYYYKSPHDDKVLGYIPLPSFKIRPVGPEDRVFRRLAFKAEHENTRTYYFAAETKSQMTQWMNALSLASIMQKDNSVEEKNINGSGPRSARPSLSSIASSASPASPSADDSDSGFHGYKSKRFQPQGSKVPVNFDGTSQSTSRNDVQQRPVEDRSLDEVSESSSRVTTERMNTSVDSCQVVRAGNRQPFYANAPPKPRRLNSSYEHSSTPDRSPERDRRDFFDQAHSHTPSQTSIESHMKVPESRKQSHYHSSSSERRTPEAYGATSTIGRGDYEDVYGGSYEAHHQQQHLNSLSRQRESFASSRSGGTRLSEDGNLSVYSQGVNPTNTLQQGRDDSLPRNWQQFHRKPLGPPRPHSADFLEYDRIHGTSEMITHRRGSGGDILTPPQEPRPKSSVGYLPEGDFWSEENYALKMRESALYKSYLHNGTRYSDHQSYPSRPSTSFSHSGHPHSRSHSTSQTPQPVGQRIPPAGAATPDLYMPQSATAPQKSVSSHVTSHNQSEMPRTVGESRYTYHDEPSSAHGTRRSPLQRRPQQLLNGSPNSARFLRSASARLSRNKPDDSHNSSFQEDGPESDKKIQQREESMKRLLEWKQRMLQSPLTRKSSSRPDSSASSTSSNKLNTSHNLGYVTPQLHFDSESYRQQVLQELTSQELRTQMQVEGRLSAEPLPNSHWDPPNTKRKNLSSNDPHLRLEKGQQSGESDRSPPEIPATSEERHRPEERPNPSGGSVEMNDFSGVNLNLSRRREARREASRTRHVSGGESKRSASSSSRYNSYSSDEQDIVEERNTRRKSRRNSRKNNLDQKSDSKRHQTNSSSRGRNSSTKPPDSKQIFGSEENNASLENSSAVDQAHDYVNIEAISGDESKSKRKNSSSKIIPIAEPVNCSGSQRAVPVFIDDPETWIKEVEAKNCVYNDKFYAKRDPFYVSDVQMPSKSEPGLPEASYFPSMEDTKNDGNQISTALVEHEYENTFIQHKSDDTISPTEALVSEDKEKAALPHRAFLKPGVLNPDQVYENSSGDSHFGNKGDTMYSFEYPKIAFQDDNSLGKYSDSGYDTLRAEINQKRDERYHFKHMSFDEKTSNESVGEVPPKLTSHVTRRPDTWSPDKFERSWNHLNNDSKVDESEIVKEYSYEYITTDENVQSNLRDMSVHSQLSTPNLPYLESPKIVQETQLATNRNLVKDRIKCFSSISEPSKPLEKMYADVDLGDQNGGLDRKTQKVQVIDSLKDLLPPLSPSCRSVEAHVSNIKENFVSSLSTKVHTQEAQVKSLSDCQSTNELFNKSSPCNSLNSCSELSSLEYRDIKSPQEIMDSRLTRSNIRKFVFEEGDISSDASSKQQIPKNTPENASISREKRSVKELLKNFENKLEDSKEFTFSKSDCKRKFHSDSELLSNESSSEESSNENLLGTDKLPPPPPSFLQELREEATKNLEFEESSLLPPPRPPKKPSLSGEIDSRGRPRSIRLSLSESIEESLRLGSGSEAEENNWYGIRCHDSSQSINKDSLSGRHLADTFENNNTLIIDMDRPPKEPAPPPPTALSDATGFVNTIEENNYLPMSPPSKTCKISRNVITPSSASNSVISKHLLTLEPLCSDHFGKMELEEHTYIEMTGEPSPKTMFPMKGISELPKLDVCRMGGEFCISPESPRYYEIGEKEGQHYEYIYKTGPHYEAIYMEVPNAEKDTLGEDKKPKPPQKPHDLKPFHKKCSSDSALPSSSKSKATRASDGSSDADDEASKDFESIEPPRKPRFSLSDTFRPASYYLSGADHSTDFDAHDSSDSDLVSPPPIPLTSPPVEESESNQEGLKYKKMQGFDSKPLSNSPVQNLTLNSSSSQLLKFGSHLEHDIKSSPTPFYHKRSDSGSSVLSNKVKRRPLLEETLDEYNDDESFILGSEDIYPTSLSYPDDKNNEPSSSPHWSTRRSSKGGSDMSLLQEEYHRDSFGRPNSSLGLNNSYHSRNSGRNEESGRDCVYENSQFIESPSVSAITGPYMNVPANSRALARETDSLYPRELQVSLNQPTPEVNLSFSGIGSRRNSQVNSPHMFFSDRSSIETRERTMSPLQGNFTSPVNANHQRSSSELSARSLSSPVNATPGVITPVHVRGSSNASMNSEPSPRTAPYYYSDVIRDENVQLPDEFPVPRTRAYQLNNQRELEGNKRPDIGRKVNQISTNSVNADLQYRERLNNELKHSFELFDGKTICVPDERNVYEADTLRKMKSRTRTPDPDQNSKNIYPYGISVKMDDTVDLIAPTHRRTRSLEGFLEEGVPSQRKMAGELTRNIRTVNRCKSPFPEDPTHFNNSINMLNRAQAQRPDSRNFSSTKPTSHITHLNPPASPYTPNGGVNFHGKDSIPPNRPVPETPEQNFNSNIFPRNYPQYPGMQDHIEPRDGSTSRMSLHDTFSIGSGEATNWEDDCQWKEQLRRASLRHTRSLETLDDSRGGITTNEAGSSSSTSDSRAAPKFSLPTNASHSSPREERVRSPQRSLDEYHVDYREGRIPPAAHYPCNETFDRTRKGLTSLEEYEWDATEEKFKKPMQVSTDFYRNTPKHSGMPSSQPFLADGLLPSLEKGLDRDMSCKSPRTPFEGGQNSSTLHPVNQGYSAERVCLSPEDGGRPIEESNGNVQMDTSKLQKGTSVVTSSGDNNLQEPVGSLYDTTFNTSVSSAPDLIPEQDVNKLGENFHRRSDLNNPKGSSKYNHSDLPVSSYNYGIGNTYHSTLPTSSGAQPYHFPVHSSSYSQYNNLYKGDEFDKYSSTYHHNQSPQHNYHYTNYDPGYQGPTYQNYRSPYNYNINHSLTNNPIERAKESLYHHRFVGDGPNPDGYSYSSNVGRNLDSYDPAFREIERLREEEILLRQDPSYITRYPESELTVAKPSPPAPPPPTSRPQEEPLTSQRNYLAGVSAGELLGKTHEELVLLLIQLRRHQSALLAARKHTALERDSQARLAHLDNEHTDEHLRRISYLEEHLHDLDKQYQMGKPLINLVDNMVKLGSLYRGFDSRSGRSHGNNSRLPPYQSPKQDSIEFSRRILERRILAEDRREYESVTPDQIDLEEKVVQLYKLEKRLQDESLTIQGLQREKDMLEKTLENYHTRSHAGNQSILEVERTNRQRDHLERELSRLRSHLAVSARRLEDTATENSRLEHEMMMLRQKIQSNMARNAQRECEGSSEARHIESEMLRVQSLLEDLQKRRLELSQQIQRLTSCSQGTVERRASPVGITQAHAQYLTRRKSTTWLETDLDTMVTRDRGCDSPEDVRITPSGRNREPFSYSPNRYGGREMNINEYSKESDFPDVEYQTYTQVPDYAAGPNGKPYSDNRYRTTIDSDLPVLNLSQASLIEDEESSPSTGYGPCEGLDHYKRSNEAKREPVMDRDALDNKPDGEEERSSPLHLDINEADDRMKRYYGILPKEKFLEPKTVRIVKRESTERKKDRFLPGKRTVCHDDASGLSYVAEDEMESDHSEIENEPPPVTEYAKHSVSLPRNYGRVGPAERVNMMSALIRPNHAAINGSSSTLRPSNLPIRSKQNGWKVNNEHQKEGSMSAHEQLFGFPRRRGGGGGLNESPPPSPTKSDPPSPVFKSEAAREIIKEMAWEAEKHRRAVPKEKRRHFTISSSKPLALETGSGLEEGARSRDDCDMVRALRPRNHPDVVKSTLSTRDLRFNESTIDTILGAPRKIYIPERYLPDEDDEKELTAEEKRQREEKAISIRRMLTESSAAVTKSEPAEELDQNNEEQRPPSSKFNMKAEKKEREHILEMNQILAKQVMEKSRIVAAHTVASTR